MNTVGKTLVILNFVFALIVGGLLVFDVALRNQWKERYETLLREAKVLEVARQQDQKIMQKLTADLRGANIDKETTLQKMSDNDKLYEINERTLRDEKQVLENKLKNADILLAQSQKTQKRMGDEITVLYTTIKEREFNIVKLEGDVKKYRIEAQNYESIARARQTQNENLLEQIRDLTRDLARIQSGVSPDSMVILDPTRPNPPAVKIDGKIERVDGDLVQLSLGTDHGLNKNNTLDVYRMQPEAKYLGMIRIIDAKHQSSVGRIVQTGNVGFRPVLKQGDLVASKITR